jgi:hypothetical protein
MKYLLSDGRTTFDTLTYVKDKILLNMKLLKREIPYFKGGSSELIPDMRMEDLTKSVESIVSEILYRVKLEFPNIYISIISSTIKNSTISVKVNINGFIDVYQYQF